MSINDQVTESTVARIDERTKSIQTELVQIRIDIKQNTEAVTDRIRDVERRHDQELSDIVEKHESLVKKMDSEFVRKDEFSWMQKTVYGFVAFIVMSVIAALLASVIVPKLSDRPSPLSVIKENEQRQTLHQTQPY